VALLKKRQTKPLLHVILPNFYHCKITSSLSAALRVEMMGEAKNLPTDKFATDKVRVFKILIWPQILPQQKISSPQLCTFTRKFSDNFFFDELELVEQMPRL